MAGPTEPERAQPVRAATTSNPSRLSLVKPIYLAGVLQLLIALVIGVVGMFASSKNCVLSITWIYFFNSVWFIVSSSVALSPTRRGIVSYGMTHIKRTMKWYRVMCVVGLLLIFGFMTVELIGLLQEPEPETTERWNCMTMHLTILSVGFVSLLVTIGGIVVTTRVILTFGRMQRQGIHDTFSPQTNTVSGNLGHINLGMSSDVFVLPVYSVDADLPPTYNDVISGKADRLEYPVSVPPGPDTSHS